MLTDTRDQRLQRRIASLYDTDPQFAAAAPDPIVSAAADDPALSLPEIIRTVMTGYADRPAVGQRVVTYRRDPDTGRTTAVLQPQFETLTYGQLWDRVQAVTAALADTVHRGDRVAILGFTSVDYTTIDIALTQLAAVAVPCRPARRCPCCPPSSPRPNPR